MKRMGSETFQGKTIECIWDKGPDRLAGNPTTAVLSSQPVPKFTVVGSAQYEIIDSNASYERSIRASDCEAHFYPVFFEERQTVPNPRLCRCSRVRLGNRRNRA